MKIIPAIDIIDGKCVRLSKGNYNSQITYNQNPLEVATKSPKIKQRIITLFQIQINQF